MSLNDLAAIASIILTLGTIVGLVFALGKRDARLESLEGRCREEWSRNSDQHKEFYASSDAQIALGAKFEDFSRRLERMELGIEKILDRMSGDAK